jgi:hypothetical protein
MEAKTSVVKIPMAFVRNTLKYRQDNDLTVAKLAAIVLKAYEPPKTVVLFAEEFKAKHNLSEAEYGVCCQMGKQGKYFYIGEEKYQYVKTVWHLYH